MGSGLLHGRNLPNGVHQSLEVAQTKQEFAVGARSVVAASGVTVRRNQGDDFAKEHTVRLRGRPHNKQQETIARQHDKKNKNWKKWMKERNEWKKEMNERKECKKSRQEDMVCCDGQQSPVRLKKIIERNEWKKRMNEISPARYGMLRWTISPCTRQQIATTPRRKTPTIPSNYIHNAHRPCPLFCLGNLWASSWAA